MGLFGEDGCGECGPCKSRKKGNTPKKKDPNHILADASLKGLEANAKATIEYLARSVQEFHAENAELAKKNKKLKKQLRKQGESQAEEIRNLEVDHHEILSNLCKREREKDSRIERMQEAINGKERVLSEQGREIIQLKEGQEASNKIEQTISEIMTSIGKDARKPELEDAFVKIKDVLAAAVTPPASEEVGEGSKTDATEEIGQAQEAV